MRIVIIALGSRGDVQPYIALGKGLKEAGHTVRIVTHQNFETLANCHGLDFWGVKGNVQNILESEHMRKLLAQGNFLAITAETSKLAKTAAVDWAKSTLSACQGMNLIIAGIGGLFLALCLAEKLKLPLLQAYLVPFTPTKAFPSVLLPSSLAKLGGSFNYISHNLTQQAIWQGCRLGDKSMRQEVFNLTVSPFWGRYNDSRLHQYPILYGFSPSVIPKPADWHDNIYITGDWFLDLAPNWMPPSNLIEFMESGSTPIYVGFGSMSNRQPEETTDLILQALARTKQRAIILSGWSGLCKNNLPDTVYAVDSIPHSWLFPRVAAIVHHGGAGTTAASLRAGLPSIFIPFFGDQFFWGHRAMKLGVAPPPIPRKQLTVERLEQAIKKALEDKSIGQNAANLGAKIQAENGTLAAVNVVNQLEKQLANERLLTQS